MKTQALTLCSLMVLGFTNAFLPPMLNTPATSTTSLTRFAENETMESKFNHLITSTFFLWFNGFCFLCFFDLYFGLFFVLCS